MLRTFLVLFAVNIRIGFGFYCVSSGEWIPIDWVCDAQSDCSDSSDESYDLNCVYQKIFLKKGRESSAMRNPWRGIHRRSDSDFIGVYPGAYGTTDHTLGSTAPGGIFEDDSGFLDTYGPQKRGAQAASGPGQLEVGGNHQSGLAARRLYDLLRESPSAVAASPMKSAAQELSMTSPLHAKHLPSTQSGTAVYTGGHVTNDAVGRRAALSSDDDNGNDVSAYYGHDNNNARLFVRKSAGHELMRNDDLMSEHH